MRKIVFMIGLIALVATPPSVSATYPQVNGFSWPKGAEERFGEAHPTSKSAGYLWGSAEIYCSSTAPDAWVSIHLVQYVQGTWRLIDAKDIFLPGGDPDCTGPDPYYDNIEGNHVYCGAQTDNTHDYRTHLYFKHPGESWVYVVRSGTTAIRRNCYNPA